MVYLDLSNNAISSLTEKTFASLNRLAYLDLSSNPIQTFAEHIFDNLVVSLVQLNLADVGSVDVGDFHFPELVSLNISYNMYVTFNYLYSFYVYEQSFSCCKSILF